MLYKKNSSEQLSPDLFRNPTSEYRGTPFWAWNGKLEEEELVRQIEVFKEMGLGGFHMHVRTGMETPYLSEEFKKLVRACTDKAKKEEMLAWLYDEDRWPSGAAGGLITKDHATRRRHALFTAIPYGKNEKNAFNGSQARAVRQGDGTLLAIYDIELTDDGYLKSYKRIENAAEAKHEVRYLYMEIAGNSTWYNNQAYINTLDKKAMDKFIDLTYNFYKDAVGDEFDETVPAIFTDEPQFTRKSMLTYADDKIDVTMPWTDDLDDTFREAYGESLIDSFPELIWDLADGKISVIRYHYHDHIAERFASAFADNCGKWCKENNLKLTGHMMEEPTLLKQTAALGEAMRSYRSFQLPGIDMLQARFEYTTAKQCQSAVHQYGYEGMMSELYGVTGWDFDFRGHKLHGDWQAALGVTIRVPHLSWYTMKGEAKRDYPASIHYQSPWFKEYSYVEDHFARVASAMTRGTPDVKVAVIHPVESYWLHWGPEEQTAAIRNQLDSNFLNLTEWLLFGSIDFDFISESLLPDQCKNPGAPLSVGKMNYNVVIVPECETIRSSTLERLEAFRQAGGRLIFLGKQPTLENALPSDRPGNLYDCSEQIPFSRSHLMDALDNERTISIRNNNGTITTNLLHQIRNDGDGKWLFIAHGTEPYAKDISTEQKIRIRINGEWNVTLFDTMTGDILPVSATVGKNYTEIRTAVYDYDSVLYRLTPVGAPLPEGISESDNADKGYHRAENAVSHEEPLEEVRGTDRQIPVPNEVKYTLSEQNVCLIDQAEFAKDDEPYRPMEEILRADNILRAELGIAKRGGHVVQPWAAEKIPATHTIRLRYTVYCTFRCRVPYLALEDADKATILLNGKKIHTTDCGYYVDKSIRKVLLPALAKGKNVLEVILPLGPNTNTEWMYLLGNFAVHNEGRTNTLSPLPETIPFDDITRQGFPFYSGAITYHIPVETEGGNLSVRLPRFRTTVNKITVDGNSALIAYPPYRAALPVSAGNHMLDLTAYIPRTNGFAPLHTVVDEYQSPTMWRQTGDRWIYNYRFYPEGIISQPELSEVKYK
ncbi:MAG: hypothetical protein J6C26_09840 [Clostridia bacterium]|nr:hypothetical protein [Clostridia bacterium]